MKYNGEGQLINDLAESYDISEDKTTYAFHLKKNILWHDGQNLTAHDVVFTVNLISDPAYKSPLRGNWQGVETSVIDDFNVEFRIKTPYVGFLNNLTFGVLPKHIWEGVEPENFSLTSLNLEPIGSGPYKYSSYQKDSKGNILTYKLISNPNYFEGKPYLSKITFNFYIDDDSAIDAFNRKEIMGVSGGLSSQKISDVKNPKSTTLHKFIMPRYFAVFFNQNKSLPLASDEVRQALDYATDRQEIIDKVLSGNGDPVHYPILPGMIGYKEDLEKNEFNIEKGNEVLDKNGWTRGDDGFRAKNGAALEISLVTTDWDELSKTADILKSQWEKIGIKVNVSAFSISDIQQNYIRTREYDALLFGQVLVGGDSDPNSFWHSAQKKDPGLNLALFGDSATDKLIEDGRVEFNTEKRTENYVEFQKKLHSEAPAVFLYSPNYIYPVNKSVHGMDIKNLISPSERFSNINKWYMKTKRIWK